MEKMNYLAPEIEVFDVAVESGFAISGEPQFDEFGSGGNYDEDWG